MDLLAVTYLLNGLLMVGMPLALAIFLTRRFRLGWGLWLIGMCTFVLSQVGHMPFNWLLTRLFAVGVLPAPPPDWKPYFNPVVLGLSAGLWEELTRAGVYRWWADDARSWRKGVLLGAGHGGIEAIILGLLVLFSYAYMLAYRGMDLSKVVPPEQLALAQQQVTAYWTQPWPLTLMGALERLFTIPTHIAFSVLVLQAFTRRQPGWIALAVFLHALMDAVIVYLGGIWRGVSWGNYAIEGVIGLFALLSIVIIFALRRPEPEPQPETPSEPEPAAVDMPVPVEVRQPQVTKETLDRSKYI